MDFTSRNFDLLFALNCDRHKNDIRKIEKINKRIVQSKNGIYFNEICLKEGLHPNFSNIYIYIYIYTMLILFFNFRFATIVTLNSMSWPQRKKHGNSVSKESSCWLDFRTDNFLFCRHMKDLEVTHKVSHRNVSMTQEKKRKIR